MLDPVTAGKRKTGVVRKSLPPKVGVPLAQAIRTERLFPDPTPRSRPPVWRLWPKLWEDSPLLQVDVKHSVLHRLHLLFSDLCRGVGGGVFITGSTPGSQCLQQPFPHSQEAPSPIPEADSSTKKQFTERPNGPIFEALLSFHFAARFCSRRSVSAVCLNANFVCCTF